MIFVRALKNHLFEQEGTIFRYHNHENTRARKYTMHGALFKDSLSESLPNGELSNVSEKRTRRGNSRRVRSDQHKVQVKRILNYQIIFPY